MEVSSLDLFLKPWKSTTNQEAVLNKLGEEKGKLARAPWGGAPTASRHFSASILLAMRRKMTAKGDGCQQHPYGMISFLCAWK